MADTLWIPAHIRRKPAKPETYRKTHDELLNARVSDLCAKAIAQALESMKPEQAERERV